MKNVDYYLSNRGKSDSLLGTALFVIVLLQLGSGTAVNFKEALINSERADAEDELFSVSLAIRTGKS